MLHSTDRILTTHTGSLPRPAALTALYARRAAGESVDEDAIDAEGKAATGMSCASNSPPASMSAITASSSARRSSSTSAIA